MRKFIVHTRAIPGLKTTAPTVVEVECDVIQGVEDPSVMWMAEGEYRVRISAPIWLYEPKSEKDKTMVPAVWPSHNFYWTVIQARVAAERLVRSEFEFAFRKHGTEYTEEEFKAKCAEIQEIILP